jgi:hypothetical protein
MTLWACPLSTNFLNCAAAYYSVWHILIVFLVLGVFVPVLLYYATRWLFRR